MTSQFWLWLDTFAMAIGGAAILFLGKRRTAGEEGHTIYHGIVPIIAALSYFAMACGQGGTLLSLGAAPAEAVVNPATGAAAVLGARVFYFARYIDWSFTTPLLLLPLAQMAMHHGEKRHDLTAGLLLADLMMIVTSLFFGFSSIPWIKWTWFIISCGAFVAVLWVMWVPLMQMTKLEREDIQQNYRRDVVLLTVLWFTYPIILLFGTDGLGVVGEVFSVAFVAIVDFVAKVVYGLLTIRGYTSITDRDLAALPQAAGTTRRVA